MNKMFLVVKDKRSRDFHFWCSIAEDECYKTILESTNIRVSKEQFHKDWVEKTEAHYESDTSEAVYIPESKGRSWFVFLWLLHGKSFYHPFDELGRSVGIVEIENQMVEIKKEINKWIV